MDTSSVLSILSIAISLFSVAISVAFALYGLHFSNKADKTLTNIETTVNVQRENFMKLIEQAHTNYHENVTNVMKMTMQMMMQMMVRRGGLSSEEADDFKEELNEAIQEMRWRSFNQASVISTQNKVGGK